MKKNMLLPGCLFLLAGMIIHAQNKPGLYAGDAFQGEMDLYDSLDWITVNAQDGGEYSIILGASIAASSSVLDCKGKSVTISLKSSGEILQVSYATRSPSSSLFTIKEGVTFVLEKDVELVGRPSASRPPVTVDGGNFIMNGGVVKDSKVDHSSDWLGGGVDVLRGGNFTMNDGIISGNFCAGGAGVNVGENTTFTMNGGSISGNMGRVNGGGVFVVKNGTFTMNGGTISGNSTTHYEGGGGGVFVRGTFEMNDGIISNNNCVDNNGSYKKGGGVYVYGSGTFVMKGGTVRNNSECGIYVNAELPIGLGKSIGGTFTMYGGTVADNRGGGVYVESSLFTMNGGIISGNIASSGAGVYTINYSLVVMNDGSIIKNTANGYSIYSENAGGGGGVYVGNGVSFTMNGGTISENIATGKSVGGGGVYVESTFTMNDGTISGNYATKSGGGVLVTGIFVKSNTAGVIYGGDAAEDKANKADQYGHAVHTKNGSRDTTARATMALDSRKYGADGGWE